MLNFIRTVKFQSSWGGLIKIVALTASISIFANPTAELVSEKVEPLTQAEIQQGLKDMQIRMNQQIEAWGKTLKAEDFERSWTGRKLKKSKRQEVCGIYQNIINDIYRMAVENKARLAEQDQKLLQDRNAFIKRLGYKDNIVDTQMDFNCRIK
ncbi:hypothetical protein [Acinetobacter sp. ANC 4779]|uniref:hypothetical protein n=1 Tax=Acinetobacter sp. ANC 4779 TaxID=2529848 RepID=UPI001D193785|nr:hypothetical protein [Acinetobacter sp. ANC 4779]